MKTYTILLLIFSSTLMFSCGSDSNVDALEKELEELKKDQANSDEASGNDSQSENSDEKGKSEKVEPESNYTGTIGGIPIKAQLNFTEAEHAEGSGAVSFPITGYYFYESTKIKIPLSGEANGIGMLYLIAKTEGGDENFDGEMIGDAMLEDYSGTWSKGKKSLAFKLISKK